jgi:hypothetical protein
LFEPCIVPLASNSKLTSRIPTGLNSSRHANASVCSGPPSASRMIRARICVVALE